MTGTDETPDRKQKDDQDVDAGVPEDGAEVPPNAPVMVDPQLKDADEVPAEGADVPDYAPVMTDPQLKDAPTERDVDDGVPEGGAEVPDYTPVMTDPQLLDEDGSPRGVDAGVPEGGAEVPDYAPTMVDPQLQEATSTRKTEDTEPQPAPAPAAAAATTKSSGGGVFTLLLGGALAAALGFAAAFFYFEGELAPGGSSAELEATLQEQRQRIDALEAGLADAGTPGEDPALAEEIAILREDASAQVADAVSAVTALDERLAGIETRLADLEARPAGGGDGQPADLGGLPDDVAALRGTVETIADDLSGLQDQIGELEGRMSRQEEGAIAAADEAFADAALTRIQTALGTGEPFADALADLSARMEAPELATLGEHAASGVATAQELARDFPAAARAALSAIRSGSEATGLGAFVQSRLNIRSVEPREGDDPDAVLSRIGAAVDEGRVADALTEIDLLPEEAQTAMADWIVAARARADAVNAASTLNETMISN
ncbi:hypothetical protein AADZ90_005070 [Aestuariibius sp. 2305UL40-4]|uniref:hypothetical protein n=1 Tax=Aestuariibius violaceus TaxID=3234132 RepID=UPI00345EF9B7